jgi:hypothetical protein
MFSRRAHTAPAFRSAEIFFLRLNPVLQCRHVVGKSVAPCKETGAVAHHRILIGWLVAKINAPSDVVAVIRCRAVNAPVIKQDSAPGSYRERYSLSFELGKLIAVNFGVAGIRAGFIVIAQHALPLRTGPNL